VAAVIEKNGRFLVVEELQDQKTVINQPAGHLEKDENLQAAIIREVKEETAWQFVPETIIGIYHWHNSEKNITYLRVCFAGSVNKHNKDIQLDNGILGTHWLTYDEILNRRLRSPMVKQCIDDYISGKCYPLDLLNELP